MTKLFIFSPQYLFLILALVSALKNNKNIVKYNCRNIFVHNSMTADNTFIHYGIYTNYYQFVSLTRVFWDGFESNKIFKIIFRWKFVYFNIFGFTKWFNRAKNIFPFLPFYIKKRQIQHIRGELFFQNLNSFDSIKKIYQIFSA